VIVLGWDTATPSTAVAVLHGDRAVERRHDPPAGSRGAHASRLLALVAEALAAAGVGWEAIDRIAVGVGPGGFTGLRIGIATARALAQARAIPLVPVSSLRALAAPHLTPERPVLAALDARRAELFAAAWLGDALLLGPVALPPAALAARLADLPAAPLAVGDGAVRFRTQLEGAGAAVPADDSPAHRLAAEHVCRLGARGGVADRDAVLPDYLREPDATPPSR